MEPHQAPDHRLKSAYDYTVGGRTLRIPADADATTGVRPILHLKLFHPDNDHYGMSPLEAAASAIDLHNTAAQWNVVPEARH